MKTIAELIDRVLHRVPTDSVHGRATHRELLEHFEDKITDETNGKLELAITRASESFGDLDDLERQYYDDYARARFRVCGLLDRENWTPHRIATRLGTALVVIGLVLGWLVPGVASFAAALAVQRAAINDLGEFDAEGLRTSTEFVVESPLLGWLDLRIGSMPAGRVLAGIGLALVILGAIATLRHVHRRLARQTGLALGVFGATALAFVLGAASVDAYGSLLIECLFVDPGTGATTPTEAPVWVWPLVAAAFAGCAWLWWSARHLGLGDTRLIRHAAFAVAVGSLGAWLVSHPGLVTTAARMREHRDAVAPAQLAGAFGSDLMMFVAGTLLAAWATLRFGSTLEEAWRTRVGRAH